MTADERVGRILFDGIVDYAGLYPPAALDMSTAVRNYAQYRTGESAWILGRFVCPTVALASFSVEAGDQLPRAPEAAPWRLSATGSGDIAADVQATASFNARHAYGAVVDTIEVKATSIDDIDVIDDAVPRDITTYIEIPVASDPTPWLVAIARVGRRPKIRMGGVTPDAFPSSANVVRFLRACAEHQLVAKATAGLHHPLRGTYRLTYDANAPLGLMFGFLNVFLATALLASGGPSDAVQRLVEESDAGTIVMHDDGIVWHDGAHDHYFDRALLTRVRATSLVSFGSCSFREPVDESRALGVL